MSPRGLPWEPRWECMGSHVGARGSPCYLAVVPVEARGSPRDAKGCHEMTRDPEGPPVGYRGSSWYWTSLLKSRGRSIGGTHGMPHVPPRELPCYIVCLVISKTYRKRLTMADSTVRRISHRGELMRTPAIARGLSPLAPVGFYLAP